LAGQFAAIEPAMTGRENLELIARLFGRKRKDAKASASSVLDSLGLTDAGDRLVRTYSGGMRRRLDLGASLVGAPKLLLLDEPTRRVSVSVDSGGPVLMNALRAVEDAGVDVEDVALRQPKLDEVFLTLTGRPDADAVLEAAAS